MTHHGLHLVDQNPLLLLSCSSINPRVSVAHCLNVSFRTGSSSHPLLGALIPEPLLPLSVFDNIWHMLGAASQSKLLTTRTTSSIHPWSAIASNSFSSSSSSRVEDSDSEIGSPLFVSTDNTPTNGWTSKLKVIGQGPHRVAGLVMSRGTPDPSAGQTRCLGAVAPRQPRSSEAQRGPGDGVAEAPSSLREVDESDPTLLTNERRSIWRLSS